MTVAKAACFDLIQLNEIGVRAPGIAMPPAFHRNPGSGKSVDLLGESVVPSSSLRRQKLVLTFATRMFSRPALCLLGWEVLFRRTALSGGNCSTARNRSTGVPRPNPQTPPTATSERRSSPAFYFVARTGSLYR